LSLAEDPRALAAEGDLRRDERKWLLNIQKKLDFSGLDLTGLFPPEVLARAEQAYKLLISVSSAREPG
jgi:hypothetical protein